MLTLLHRRGRDERGATLVIFCLILVGLLTVAGLVLDFGLVRANRTENKGAADVAVAAGLRSLELAGYPAPFRGVCGAVAYLKANHSQLAGLTTADHFKYGNGVDTVSSDPCTAAAPEQLELCMADTPSTWATYEQTLGGLTVTIQSGYDPDDPLYADEALIAGTDPGDPAYGNCDHLAVMITETSQPGFGKVAYGGSLSTKIRSVGRVTVESAGEAAIGLLLLERQDCAAADVAGNTAQIAVVGTGAHPGIVHSDSIGGGADCGSKWVLNGQYPTPGIIAHSAPVGGAPGEVTTRGLQGTSAQKLMAISHWDPSSGSPSEDVEAEDGTPTGADLVGRIHVDTKYHDAITDLRAKATDRFSWTSAPSGWEPSTCTPSAAALAAAKVWVSCATFANTAQFAATEIVFTGIISLGGGTQSLKMPNAKEVYVKGVTGGTSLAVGNNKTITLNTGPSTPDRCAIGNPPAVDVALPEFATLVIGSGKLSATSGELRLCRTMVFMMDGSLYPKGQAPTNNGFQGAVQAGSGGTLRWTAPNTILTRPTETDMATSPFEDLALWSESSAHAPASLAHSLGGGSDVTLKGVFFAPNANAFKLAGNSSLSITNSAQFIVRKLSLVGNSVLSLRADPESSVLVPRFTGFTLVR